MRDSVKEKNSVQILANILLNILTDIKDGLDAKNSNQIRIGFYTLLEFKCFLPEAIINAQKNIGADERIAALDQVIQECLKIAGVDPTKKEAIQAFLSFDFLNSKSYQDPLGNTHYVISPKNKPALNSPVDIEEFVYTASDTVSGLLSLPRDNTRDNNSMLNDQPALNIMPKNNWDAEKIKECVVNLLNANDDAVADGVVPASVKLDQALKLLKNEYNTNSYISRNRTDFFLLFLKKLFFKGQVARDQLLALDNITTPADMSVVSRVKKLNPICYLFGQLKNRRLSSFTKQEFSSINKIDDNCIYFSLLNKELEQYELFRKIDSDNIEITAFNKDGSILCLPLNASLNDLLREFNEHYKQYCDNDWFSFFKRFSRNNLEKKLGGVTDQFAQLKIISTHIHGELKGRANKALCKALATMHSNYCYEQKRQREEQESRSSIIHIQDQEWNKLQGKFFGEMKKMNEKQPATAPSTPTPDTVPSSPILSASNTSSPIKKINSDHLDSPLTPIPITGN